MERSDHTKRIGNNWSLMKKIAIAFLLAALVPLIFISAFQLFLGTDILEGMAADELEHLSIGVAGRFDQLLEDNKVAATQLSSDPTVVAILLDPTDNEAKAAAEARFQKILESNTYYEYVYLLDADGTAIVSIQQDGLPTVEGRSFRDRQYFLRAREGFHHLDALVGRESKKLGFYFTAPVYNEYNQVMGVAAIKLQGESITEMFNSINAKSKSVSVFLVDHDGVVVSAPEDQTDWYLKGVAELSPEDEEIVEARFVMDEPLQYVGIPELADLLGSDEGILGFVDPQSNEAYIVGYQATDNLSWVTGVAMSEAIFMEPISDLAWKSALSAVVMIALVFLLAIFMARGIAQPIMKLARAAERVERGESFAPADITSVMSLGDEVGHLARVFSDMVLALRARMAELQTIYEIGQKISSSVELSDTLQDVVSSLGNVIDFDAAEICLYDAQDKELERYVTRDDVMSDDETVQKVTYSPKKDYFPRLFTDSHGLLVADIAAFEKYTLTSARSWDVFEPKSYLGVSLRYRGRVVGTIELVNSQVDGFSEGNLRILESISIQAAVAISNAQEVRNRERRLINMEIVVDESRVDEELTTVTETDFFKSLKEKTGRGRSKNK